MSNSTPDRLSVEGSSVTEDLAVRAAELGLPAIAVLDRNNVSNAPRFHIVAKRRGITPAYRGGANLHGRTAVSAGGGVAEARLLQLRKCSSI
jgi:DNA polymerase III alpha subunit